MRPLQGVSSSVEDSSTTADRSLSSNERTLELDEKKLQELDDLYSTDSSPESDDQRQPRLPLMKKKVIFHGDHTPHELSTIQEVETPKSDTTSGESYSPMSVQSSLRHSVNDSKSSFPTSSPAMPLFPATSTTRGTAAPTVEESTPHDLDGVFTPVPKGIVFETPSTGSSTDSKRISGQSSGTELSQYSITSSDQSRPGSSMYISTPLAPRDTRTIATPRMQLVNFEQLTPTVADITQYTIGGDSDTSKYNTTKDTTRLSMGRLDTTTEDISLHPQSISAAPSSSEESGVCSQQTSRLESTGLSQLPLDLSSKVKDRTKVMLPPSNVSWDVSHIRADLTQHSIADTSKVMADQSTIPKHYLTELTTSDMSQHPVDQSGASAQKSDLTQMTLPPTPLGGGIQLSDLSTSHLKKSDVDTTQPEDKTDLYVYPLSSSSESDLGGDGTRQMTQYTMSSSSSDIPGRTESETEISQYPLETTVDKSVLPSNMSQYPLETTVDRSVLPSNMSQYPLETTVDKSVLPSNVSQYPLSASPSSDAASLPDHSKPSPGRTESLDDVSRVTDTSLWLTTHTSTSGGESTQQSSSESVDGSVLTQIPLEGTLLEPQTDVTIDVSQHPLASSDNERQTDISIEISVPRVSGLEKSQDISQHPLVATDVTTELTQHTLALSDIEHQTDVTTEITQHPVFASSSESDSSAEITRRTLAQLDTEPQTDLTAEITQHPLATSGAEPQTDVTAEITQHPLAASDAEPQTDVTAEITQHALAASDAEPQTDVTTEITQHPLAASDAEPQTDVTAEITQHPLAASDAEPQTDVTAEITQHPLAVSDTEPQTDVTTDITQHPLSASDGEPQTDVTVDITQYSLEGSSRVPDSGARRVPIDGILEEPDMTFSSLLSDTRTTADQFDLSESMMRNMSIQDDSDPEQPREYLSDSLLSFQQHELSIRSDTSLPSDDQATGESLPPAENTRLRELLLKVMKDSEMPAPPIVKVEDKKPVQKKTGVFKKPTNIVTKNSTDRKKDQKDMSDRNKRLYNQLNDVKEKKLQQEREKQYAANREKAKEFQKKIRESLMKKRGK